MIKNTDLLNGNKNPAPWCAVFIIACLYDIFGVEKTHLYLNIPKNSAAAGCSFLYEYLKPCVVNEPSEGCIIFFGDKKPTHVGYVYKVDDKKVYTIEGNSDNQVKKHSYNITSNKIFAWCRPLYFGAMDDAGKGSFKVKAISGLRVRKEPNTNCKIIRILKFGSIVDGTFINKEWIKIKDGYISSKWVEVTK